MDLSMNSNDLTKEFTVIFLFNNDCTSLLLQNKKRGPFLNRWNGVGGHLKQAEVPIFGAVREVSEETGIKTWDLDFICSIRFHNEVHLHCFCGRVKMEDVHQIEDEPLQWFSLPEVEKLPLAGDGNIPWLINESLGILLRK